MYIHTQWYSVYIHTCTYLLTRCLLICKTKFNFLPLTCSDDFSFASEAGLKKEETRVKYKVWDKGEWRAKIEGGTHVKVSRWMNNQRTGLGIRTLVT